MQSLKSSQLSQVGMYSIRFGPVLHCSVPNIVSPNKLILDPEGYNSGESVLIIAFQWHIDTIE